MRLHRQLFSSVCTRSVKLTEPTLTTQKPIRRWMEKTWRRNIVRRSMSYRNTNPLKINQDFVLYSTRAIQSFEEEFCLTCSVFEKRGKKTFFCGAPFVRLAGYTANLEGIYIIVFLCIVDFVYKQHCQYNINTIRFIVNTYFKDESYEQLISVKEGAPVESANSRTSASWELRPLGIIWMKLYITIYHISASSAITVCRLRVFDLVINLMESAGKKYP